MFPHLILPAIGSSKVRTMVLPFAFVGFFIFPICLASLLDWNDAYEYPKYSFEWSNVSILEGDIDSIKEKTEKTKLSSLFYAGKHEYFCVYPNASLIKQNSTTEPSYDLQELRIQGTEKINELANVFLIENRGYWTYDYVYGQHVRQYHLEPQQGSDKVLANPMYILGTAPNTQTKKNLEENWAIGFVEGKAYLQTTFRNGTMCDITKRPRHVILSYECSTNSDTPEITQYQEVSSCAYSMTIHVPGLCSLPAFKIQEDIPSEKIVCYNVIKEKSNEVDHKDSQHVVDEVAQTSPPEVKEVETQSS